MSGHGGDSSPGPEGRAGFTLVETIVAMCIMTVVLVGAWGLFETMAGGRKTSAVRLTGASFLRQELRMAIEKLLGRVEEGIEIVEPPPGGCADHLVFKDMLNHSIHLGLNDRGELVTRRSADVATCQDEGPEQPIQIAGGALVTGLHPVRVPQVSKVFFRVLSPSLVSIELTLRDSGQDVTLVATGRLQNSTMVDD